MNHHSSAEKETQAYIDEIRSIVSVVACALVSPEGLIIGKYFREGSPSPSLLFAAASATVLASAEAACSSMHTQQPAMITIATIDATILIFSAGEAALITAVIDKSTDLPTVQGQLATIATRIGEVM
jgi:predicted regulator of Ras-like GTPase activity (Roadblock/LC7/MglB family)